MVIKFKRRRRGGTSPPLVCVEWNPGPKRAAKRRPSTKLHNSKSHKKPRGNNDHLDQGELNELKDMINSGQSLQSIIREGKFSKKVVDRWAKRLRETGDVTPRPRFVPVPEQPLQPSPAEAKKKQPKRRNPQLSEFEKV